MTKFPLRKIYRWLLSLSLVVLGICLIAACVGIYLSGDRPFSAEAVSAAFQKIAVPVWACIALCVGGLLLEGFFPAEAEKPLSPTKLPHTQYPNILHNLRKKLALSQCDPDMARQILAQRRLRKLLTALGFGVLAVCSVLFLLYALDPEHFHSSDISQSMIRAMWVFLPCLAIPFAAGILCAYLCKRSMGAEIRLTKQAIAAGCVKKQDASQPTPRFSWDRLLPFCILAVGVGILVYGFFAGGTADVLTKAVNICTECVGLG